MLGGELLAGARGFHALPPQLDPPFAETSSVQALRAAGGRYAVLGGMNLMLPMPAGTLGLSALHGAAPMVPRRAAELLACIEGPRHDPREPRVVAPLTDPASLDHALLDLLDVRAVVFGDPALHPALDPALMGAAGVSAGDATVEGSRPLLFAHPDEGLAAWSRPGAGPFAFLCGGAEVVPAADARLAWLSRPDAPIHATVLVERPLEHDLPVRGAMLPLEVGRATDDAMGLECEAPFAGVVVLAEAWDPGWSATLDGRPAPVLVVDHALLGLEVGPGRHQIVFRYAPPGLRGAVVVSLAALALLAVAALSAARVGSGRPLAPETTDGRRDALGPTGRRVCRG